MKKLVLILAALISLSFVFAQDEVCSEAHPENVYCDLGPEGLIVASNGTTYYDSNIPAWKWEWSNSTVPENHNGCTLYGCDRCNDTDTDFIYKNQQNNPSIYGRCSKTKGEAVPETGNTQTITLVAIVTIAAIIGVVMFKKK